jgi:hypothetical protein
VERAAKRMRGEGERTRIVACPDSRGKARAVRGGHAAVPACDAARKRAMMSPRDDGSVIQRWETSDDAGASWRVGVYRKQRAGGGDAE